MHRLGDRDDDVRSVAASCLLPVAGHLVAQLPEELSRVLAVLWNCLRDMRDDLSSSVGAVMELLGKRKLLDVITATFTKHVLIGKLVKYDEVIAILGNQTESCVSTSCNLNLPLILFQRAFIRPFTHPIPFLPPHHCRCKAGRRQYSPLIYDCPYIVQGMGDREVFAAAVPEPCGRRTV